MIDITNFLRVRENRLEVLIVGVVKEASYYALNEGYATPLSSRDRAVWIANLIKEYSVQGNVDQIVLDCRLEEYTHQIASEVIDILGFDTSRISILVSSDPKDVFSSYHYTIDRLGDIDTYFFYSNLLQRNIDWENVEIDIPIISLAARPTLQRARLIKDLADMCKDKARLSFGNLQHWPLKAKEIEIYADILNPHSFPLMQNTDDKFINFPGFFQDHVGENLFQSLVSVINETNDFDNESVLLTEKSFKHFAWHQIPIFNATKGHVEVVRSLGFDLFDDIIDHSYDNAPNSHIQHLKILTEVAKFLKKYPTTNDVNKLRRGIFHRLQSNNNLLNRLYQQRPYEPWPYYG